MVSSTFRDLEDLRKILIDAIEGQDLKAVGMENEGGKSDVDLIDSSLDMVRKSAAYIALIGRRYGQMPICPIRNPERLSITELEFTEAQRLNLPIHLFLMDSRYPSPDFGIESDAIREKLAAFIERAKLFRPWSQVDRIYDTFSSLNQFTAQAVRAAARIAIKIQVSGHFSPSPPSNPIPQAPMFRSEPQYIPGNAFVGRSEELLTLSKWAAPSDPNPILLFDAIGGSGKSMLTWEWATKHADHVRSEWAGCFWYSFYEPGAVMAGFCRSALAYMTGQSPEVYRKSKMPELTQTLLMQLRSRPWLLILDGLERILVEYHRIDAASVSDEQADNPIDSIAHRDPHSAIRPEDDELLRQMAAATPSKLLITSRLIPLKLLNPATQRPIFGVKQIRLQGLRPEDAEALFRSCGIRGNSQTMQHYLENHCGCHPLVIGVLAGLVTSFLRDRGNFDVWVEDPLGGGQLDFSKLDLKQQRNHILKAGFDALPDPSRKLLSVLALVSEAVDYPTLKALNPRRPAEPAVLPWPEKPDEDSWWWESLSADEKEERELKYEEQLSRWNQSQKELSAWRRSEAVLHAERELIRDVLELDRRGFIQYDDQSKRHDLHPVVRAIAVGYLAPSDRDHLGQRVVDYFSQQKHVPYQQAETLEEVQGGLQVVRALLQMGRFQQAADAYLGNLCNPLLKNLEAYDEVLSLERAWFPQGWGVLPDSVHKYSAVHLAGDAAKALRETKQWEAATEACNAVIAFFFQEKNWNRLSDSLIGIASVLEGMNRTAKIRRFVLAALEIAAEEAEEQLLSSRRFDYFTMLVWFGQFSEAEEIWRSIDQVALERSNAYRPGMFEAGYAEFEFERGSLTEERLVAAELVAADGKNIPTIRRMHQLRGQWHMERREWGAAEISLTEAVRMFRQAGQPASDTEAMLAQAVFHVGRVEEARLEAERLSKMVDPPKLDLAELWFALGERPQATERALEAYRYAWADGEPHSFKRSLDRARSLLVLLGVTIPRLPAYDKRKDPTFSWEDQLDAAISELRDSRLRRSDGEF
jgi:hypothetical protein